MGTHLMQRLNAFSDAFSVFLLWLQHNPVILSIFAGLTLPFIFHLPREERTNAPFWLKSVACVSIFFFISGTLSPLTIQGLSFFFTVLDNHILLRLSLWILTVGFTITDLAFHVTTRRLLAGEIDSLKHRMIKKSKLERNVRTDVREVKNMLPDSIAYNPLDYIDLNNGIFIGLDKDDQPQYITREEFQTQHADLIGTIGSGKGVSACVLLYQAILSGEEVFVEDPKNDEWAPHVLREACQKAGKQFALINLNDLHFQLDLLADITVITTIGETQSAGRQIVGVIACLIATGCYGIASFLTRNWISNKGGLDPEIVAFGSQLGASIFLLPFFIWSVSTGPAVNWLSQEAWISVLAVGALCTAFAYILYFRLIADVGSLRSLTVTFLIPPFGVLWGYLALGETINNGFIMGSVIIGVAVWMVVSPKKMMQKLINTGCYLRYRPGAP